MWNSRSSFLTRTNVLPSRALPLVFRYRSLRGPEVMSAYARPSTGLVFSPAGALSVDDEPVVSDVLVEVPESDESDASDESDPDLSALTRMTLRSSPVP